jgi:heat shock protein HslJ
MRPHFLRAALAAALLAAPAAHADMVIVQQGAFPGPVRLAQPMPAPAHGSAFAMAERFILDTVISRAPAPIVISDPRPLPLPLPVLPIVPIPVEDEVEVDDPSDPISFAGSWRLAEIVDDTGAPLSVAAELLAATQFNVDIDGAFYAYAGCNGMFGELRMDDGIVSTADYGMTLMACFGPVSELERAFMGVLDNAALVAQGNGLLILLDDDGDKLAEFELVAEAP